MKQLLILSGKGGTGKTTIAGAFIKLAEAKAYADCDVDAPNLHLIINQASEVKRSNYYGLPKAVINPELCLKCDLCRQYCRFEAIQTGAVYVINPFACEGCGVCQAICPAGAVAFQPVQAGELMLYAGEAVFATAQLIMGSGNSGMLVTEVKKLMRSAVNDVALAVIDGSPGIGCPVIASISGVDLVLIVAEPSVSGISDMERIIKTAEKFQTRVAVCVNKYDTNPDITRKIEAFCQDFGIPFVGRIPFDPKAVQAINSGQSIVDLDCVSGRAVKDVFDQTINRLNQSGNFQSFAGLLRMSSDRIPT
ncbi:4Fe-4S binding protein [Desulfosporosinus sp. PR]|uniref:nucleotide-binding protein n=1 Tax=Candidatus Desulfosporosinus nitrosoreducens TaxID=3401928 RepID=UPI0027F83633|nr:4Fe-4S binding protein [Desulfosporosinus sp. PR]MDQ7095363.1 4Fe-4S binding protein [Desulfosporosinus sp. PR]